jgi:hypothetical protein
MCAPKPARSGFFTYAAAPTRWIETLRLVIEHPAVVDRPDEDVARSESYAAGARPDPVPAGDDEAHVLDRAIPGYR